MTYKAAHRRARHLRDEIRPEDCIFENYDRTIELSEESIRRVGARGTSATLVGTWTRFGLQAVSTIALAHILSPRDFGLFAMVAAIAGFGDLMRDVGLSFAIVQARALTRQQASALFWYSVGLGLAVAVALEASAPLVSDLFGQQRLLTIMPALAFGVLVGSLGAVHIALLDRALGFFRVMISDVVSATIACIAAIVVAVCGGGYWALVVLLVGQSVARTILAWLNFRWTPGRGARYAMVRHLLSFGWMNFVAQALNYGSRNVDDVIIGRQFGPAVLGQYVQAYNLLLFPLQQINAPLQRVAIPLLSRVLFEPARYRTYYLAAIRIIAVTLIPAFIATSIMAHELIGAVLGQRWDQAASFFQILSVAGITQSLGYASSWLFVSSGNARGQLHWALISRPIAIGSMFLGLPWGAKGVATAYVTASAILLVPTFARATAGTPISVRDIVVSVRSMASVPIIVGLTVLTAHKVCELSGYGSETTLAVSLAVTIGVYVAVMSSMKASKTLVMSIWKSVR